MKFQQTLTVSATVLYVISQGAAAQNPPQETVDAHLSTVNVVETIAAPSARVTFMGTKEVLSGQKLQDNRAPTLGETLEKTAGVHSEHFGPNSGRPQIRSLSGSRVQILSNDLSLNDVAIISGNLPTQIEPFMADEVEVIKGPATVLYGGSAIGGSVNVNDGRIPTRISEKKFSGKIDINGGDNTPNTQMFRLDGNNGHHWAWHIDGLRRRISDYRIPRRTKADVCYDPNEAGSNTPLRDACQMNMDIIKGGVNPAWYPYLNQYFIDHPDELESEMSRYTSNPGWLKPNPPNPVYIAGAPYYLPDRKGPLTDMVAVSEGKIPNSHLHTQSLTIGTSLIGEQGYIGVAVNRYRTEYGVPGFVYVDAWNNEINKNLGYAPANIRAEQTRWDVRAALNQPMRGINYIGLRLGYAQAKNGDYLGDALSGGLDSTSKQARLEVAHEKIGPISGVFGMAWNRRAIRSSGEDAYMPSVLSQELGGFILEKADFDPISIELGARWDKVKHRRKQGNYQDGQGWNKILNKPHDFSLHNYHAAMRWQVNDAWQIKLQRSWSQRAPEVNELYASNRHLATLSVEEGNPDQQKEKAYSWELSSSMDWEDLSAQITLYRTRFNHYSYLGYTGFSNSNTGKDPNGGRLLIRQWRQHNTDLSGLELGVRYRFLNNRSGEWTASAFGDWVKNKPRYHEESSAQRLAGSYMPNMPTTRYGAELEWKKGGLRAAAGVVHYKKQEKVGKVINDEPVLPGYTLVDAHLSYEHQTRYGTWEWYLDGKNLTNREARPFNSTLKYLAPLPGRAVTAGLRLSF